MNAALMRLLTCLPMPPLPNLQVSENIRFALEGGATGVLLANHDFDYPQMLPIVRAVRGLFPKAFSTRPPALAAVPPAQLHCRPLCWSNKAYYLRSSMTCCTAMASYTHTLSDGIDIYIYIYIYIYIHTYIHTQRWLM